MRFFAKKDVYILLYQEYLSSYSNPHSFIIVYVYIYYILSNMYNVYLLVCS